MWVRLISMIHLDPWFERFAGHGRVCSICFHRSFHRGGFGGLRTSRALFLGIGARLGPVARGHSVAGGENVEPADYKKDSKDGFFHIDSFFRLHWIRLPLSSRRCIPLPWQYFQYLHSAHCPVRIHSRSRIFAKRVSHTSTKSSV